MPHTAGLCYKLTVVSGRVSFCMSYKQDLVTQSHHMTQLAVKTMPAALMEFASSVAAFHTNICLQAISQALHEDSAVLGDVTTLATSVPLAALPDFVMHLQRTMVSQHASPFLVAEGSLGGLGILYRSCFACFSYECNICA